ncbi:IclR family transcriptional regulator [Rhizobium sp. AC44/96]|uniref:IclR family transcriptional regulator n=1 Tax=unclassified Rhizobium TaxID=2613769 RepID=UPI00080FEB62|nr:MULTISPECIES: IclR family transcriptional regulator [unclassified Rhizobium]MDM9623941.1 IclR family transcriptional regulator [Rhizobium sp. S96]OCJ08081.1 IclR family transcriptional regulator [Rhizobium sp. AC44/96]
MAVRPLSSVLKTLAAFDCVAAAPEPLRLADVARQLGEARGAAHQRLVTLVEAGWVEQTPDGRYRLTLRVVSHAAAALEQSNLGARFSGVLEEMVTQSGETASLAVLDGKDAVIVRRVESRGVLRADLKVGAHLRLDRTAFGRVLVSFARPEIIERLKAQGVDLPSDEVMAQVRANGYAISEVEGPRTVSAVAAPLLDAQGECVGALALSGPFTGFDTDKCAHIVVAAAAASSGRMRGEQ